MELHIHVHIHNDPAMQALISQGHTIMTMLTDLAAQVAASVTVEDSAITLLTGLKTSLDAAIASNDPAELAKLSQNLSDETAKLAAAITANTPAAPAA